MKKQLARLTSPTIIAILLLPTLFLIDALCYQVALPLTITVQHGQGSLSVGSIHLSLGKLNRPTALQLALHDPLIHEYQIDGSDSTNNLNLDTTYLSTIAGSPYYRFQSWMRDLDGTSRWRDLQVQANGRTIQSVAWPNNASQVTLPVASTLQISIQLQRPETPMSLNLVQNDGQTLQITLDRNNRLLTVTNMFTSQTIASAFFPVDTAPFAAMVIDTLVRITLWAVVVFLLVQFCEVGIGWMRVTWEGQRQKQSNKLAIVLPAEEEPAVDSQAPHVQENLPHEASDLIPNEPPRAYSAGPRTWRYPSLFKAIHPIALIGLGCSLVFVIWIAVKEYQGQPHIYDASAYLFAAKIYASGHLSVAAPSAKDLFPGPFMVIFNGRWFAQYDPGTALTLTPGILLGVPWLIEPLLGTLALLGIGLIAARLYDRRVATLAVLLGCLSPFYSYLAASYLSHAVALFYLVWGLWALLRFAQGENGWNMLISGFGFGMAFLTRDLVVLLYAAILIPGVLLITWERGKYKRQQLHWLAGWLVFLAIAAIFANGYLLFNLRLTGDPLTTPRNLFSSADQWGFGIGIGFYGEHTLAAGLVNMDELLTILQIDLFGWPFYLTLAFIVIPFLTGKARKADWVLLIALIITAGSYIGYFYHGIYLGPRYLFEDMPFLLILSARGILTLGAWGIERVEATAHWLRLRRGQTLTGIRPAVSLVTIALVSALILCNLIYYLPRQTQLYQNYTNLNQNYGILNTSQIYQPPVHHAIVVTGDLMLYQLMLFPLNKPQLNGDIIYAYAYEMPQYQKLLQDFPGRTLYLLVVYGDGSISYLPITQ